MGRRRIPFWTRVSKTDNCWLWTGALHRQGYGRVWGRTRPELAHRVAWELTYGPIPNRLDVLHHCDNPPCVRPDHLFLGTQLDNVRDMEAKGRGNQPKGSQHGVTHLTDTVVLTIRARYAAGGITQQVLATQYGITPATVSKIILRVNWRHI